ncbi:hypothetical protein F5Y19DRAFT_462225 [Xylariaceae sp. FL1651]|nr:hypothetical protein F5Y19DRAFT_462225 [Xylariaceae sp. FL1651]
MVLTTATCAPRIKPGKSAATRISSDARDNDRVANPPGVALEESIEPITTQGTHESHLQLTGDANSETACPSISPAYWNPPWLSVILLFVFTFLLGASTVALVVLWHVSEQNRGFPLVTTNHYSWTYGPTAILVIIVSIWHRIEYWCALLQPWKELKKGPGKASHSVLLDYVSPIIFTNLWKAISLGHYSMLVVFTGGLLLKLVIVASTGLFSPTNTRTPLQNLTLEALTVFNGSRYNGSILDVEESAFDYGAYALIAENLPFPDGIQANLAFQRFALPKNTTMNSTGSRIQAVVDVFSPQFHCEDAQVFPLNLTWDIGQGSPPGDRRFQLSVTTSWLGCRQSLPNTLSFLNAVPSPDRQLYGQTSQVSCEEDDDDTLGLFYILDVRYNQTSAIGATLQMERMNDTGSWGIQIMPITAIVCTAAYSIGTAQITYDLLQGSRLVTIETATIVYNNRSIDGFSNANFSRRLFGDVSRAKLMTGNYLSNSMDLSIPEPFWNMMALVNDNSSSYDTFVETPSKMLATAPLVLGYLGVQVADHYVVRNTSIPLDGQISFPTMRLGMSSLAFYLMLSGLTLTTIGSASSNPGNPAKLMDPLRQCTFTSKSLADIREPLTIHVSNRFPGERNKTGDTASIVAFTSSPWRPLVFKPTAFSAISLLSTSLIVALEILQHVSGQQNGIATTTSTDDYLAIFGTRLVPSLIFMTVSILYDSLSFNILLLSPFYRLRKGAATAATTINESLLDKVAPHALCIAFCHRHWAAAFSIIASLIGSVFPILVSGLYSFEMAPGPSVIAVERLDMFDPSWHDSLKDDGGAAVLLTSFEMLNLSFPSLTNHELALPGLRLLGPDKQKIQNTINPAVALRVPAVRGDLSCTLIGIESFVLDDNYLVINSSSQLPPSCESSTRSIEWSLNLDLRSSDGAADTRGWIGQMQDLHVNIPPGSEFSSGERNFTFRQDNPPGCPSLAFTFGNYSGSFYDGTYQVNPKDFTTMICTQLMAEVEVEATVSVPELRLISAEPDESTVKYLASGPNGQTAFPYRPQAHLLLEVALWNGNFTFGAFRRPDVITYYPDPNILYDGFFALMLHPENSVRLEEIVGVHNQDRLIEEIRTLYRRYMAQVASAKMRVPINSSSQAESFDATWINPDRGVLRQNVASKLGLQVILAVMFVCGISAYLLIDTKNLLYQNPCSIAGLATLLVDSPLCTGQLAENMAEKADWTQNSVWESFTFNLGWRANGEGRKRWYGIDAGQRYQEKS